MLHIGAAQSQEQKQPPGRTPERQQQRDSQVQQKYLTTSQCFRAGQCLPQDSAASGRITWTNDAWGTKGEKSLPDLIAEDYKYQDQGEGAVSQEHLLFSPTSVLWPYGKGSS